MTVTADQTSQTSPEPERYPLPIIVGVSGHRDLRPEDTVALKEKVRAILYDLDSRYDPTQIVIISPLAEGADRLVAEVGLEQSATGKPLAELIVPLPLPLHEYEKDFDTQESKQAFASLLSQASKCVELPLVEGNTAENIQSRGPERSKQYAQVGAYIARHSHILIALWDGEPSNAEGDTAQVVSFKLNGIPEPYAPHPEPLDIVDNGPVHHIWTPRLKHPAIKGEPFALKIKFPTNWQSQGSLKQSYERTLERMNSFNADAASILPNRRVEIMTSSGFVIPPNKSASLSESERFVLERYSEADTLALYFQRLRRLTLITLFSLVIIAVLGFEVYAHLWGHPTMLALYPISLLTAVALFLVSKRLEFQTKHLDYRALAEGLRVQLFWLIAGLKNEVSDHYLRQHRTELEWIRNAIRAWNVLAIQASAAPKQGGPEATDTPAAVRRIAYQIMLARDHWVEDQRKYYGRRGGQDERALRKRERMVRALFVSGITLAVATVALHVLLDRFEEHEHWHHSLIVVMGIAPAIGAAIGGYAEKMAFSAQAKRYDWMNALFERAANKLAALLGEKETGAAPESSMDEAPVQADTAPPISFASQDLPEIQKLLFDLGREALEESADWVIIHRERTADVYKVG